MSSFEENSKKIFSSLVATIRGSSRVASEDINFYTGLDDELDSERHVISDRLLHLASKVIQNASSEIDPIVDLEDLQDKWKSISNVVDVLFERTDIALDIMNGRRPQTSHSGAVMTTEAEEARPKIKLIRDTTAITATSKGKNFKNASNIPKPQLKFVRPIDNSSDHPFKPILDSKPHAIVPMEQSMHLLMPEEGKEPHYEQPYKEEIMHQPYPLLKTCEPKPYNRFSSTSAIYVDTAEKLDNLVKDLLESEEIAVDLEHHDYRSYRGFVCLMQISNRQQDWIIDTLILRDELQILNKIFTNPSILKVFHGAYMDIIWLQRDFGLYVVSLFDTYCASTALGLEKHSLAFLLEKYVSFQASKQYQLADWRIRPLPEEMLQYARADTHFLLYVYDILRNNLIKANKLQQVLEASRQVAGKKYEISGYGDGDKDPVALLNIFSKYRLSRSQQIVLRSLFSWRDKIARTSDESPGYIMPNHYMVSLSVMMPTNVASVISAGTGTTNSIRIYAKDIVSVIANAKQVIEQEDLEMENAELELESTPALDTDLIDYENYHEAFEKAVRRQTNIFDPNCVAKAIKNLQTPSSYLYKKASTNLPLILAEEEMNRRFKMIKNRMLLFIPGSGREEDEESTERSEDELSSGEQEEENEEKGDKEEEEQWEEEEEEQGEEGAEEKQDISNNSIQQIVAPEENLILVGSNKRKSEDDYDDQDVMMLPAKERRKIKRKKLRVINKASQITNLNDEVKSQKLSELNIPEKSSKEFKPLDLVNAKNVLESPDAMAERLAEEKKAAKLAKKAEKDKKRQQVAQFNPNTDTEGIPRALKKRKNQAKGRTITYKPKK